MSQRRTNRPRKRRGRESCTYSCGTNNNNTTHFSRLVCICTMNVLYKRIMRCGPRARLPFFVHFVLCPFHEPAVYYVIFFNDPKISVRATTHTHSSRHVIVEDVVVVVIIILSHRVRARDSCAIRWWWRYDEAYSVQQCAETIFRLLSRSAPTVFVFLLIFFSTVLNALNSGRRR